MQNKKLEKEPGGWIPLPTHDGYWWKYRREDGLVTLRDIVEATDPMDGEGLREDGAFYAGVLKERDSVLWKEAVAPPPPVDGKKLPRRFRWKGNVGLETTRGGAMVPHYGYVSAAWLREHASEIEWID
jgi:hypothetical protein